MMLTKAIYYGYKRQFTILFGKRFGKSELWERLQTDFDRFYIVDDLRVKEIDFEKQKAGATLIDMSKMFCGEKPCETLEHEFLENFTKLSNDNYLVEGCISSDHGPGCERKRYYLVRLKANLIKEVTNILSTPADKTCKQKFQVDLVARDLKKAEVFKINVNKLDDICRVPIKKTFLVDANMNFISETLAFGKDEFGLQSPRIGGSVYQNSKIVLQYYYSALDDGSVVLVPFELHTKLEICMFKAFNESKLSTVDLVGLGKRDKEILGELLFAKHNVRFSDKYYEAYFNLFAFYNSRSKILSRIEKDQAVLSIADTHNFKLLGIQ